MLALGRRSFGFVDTAMRFLKDILSTYTPPESSSRPTSLPALGMVSVGFIIAFKSCCYGRLQQREPLQQMLPVLTSHCPGEIRARKLTVRMSQASGQRETTQLGMSAWENCKSNWKLANCIPVPYILWIWLTGVPLEKRSELSQWISGSWGESMFIEIRIAVAPG